MQKEVSRESAWAPLALPVFRALWIAQLGSNIGVWMQTVGAQWFLVEQTRSSALVAWVQTASLLPVLLLSLLAGVLADAFDRRILLLTTTTISTVAAGVLTLIAATGTLRPWSLLLMTFVIGCGTALTAPAWQAIQPELVPREQLTAAASLGSVTVNGARAVGPAIGGVLVAFGGPVLVFGLNAISFVGVIIALAIWKRPPQKGLDHRERLLPALIAGVRYVRSGSIIRRILLRAALFAFPACALWALLPTAAQNRLGLGASGYGILLGILGVGAVIGVAVVPYLRGRFSSSVILAGSALTFALGTVAIALWPFAVVCVLSIFTGISWIASLTTLNAAMQLSLAHWVRARGMSVYLLVFMGSQAVGSFVWGALSTAVGEVGALLTAAVVLAVAALSVIVLPLRPQTGKLDRDIAALCTAAPTLVFEPQPDDGPVAVVFRYRVAPENGDAFAAAMRSVEKSRRRTGATSWRLDRSGEEAELYREEFMVRSWEEFQRQGTDRWTRSDQDSHEHAMALAKGAPTETHFFPV